jgi:hypothetical protein
MTCVGVGRVAGAMLPNWKWSGLDLLDSVRSVAGIDSLSFAMVDGMEWIEVEIEIAKPLLHDEIKAQRYVLQPEKHDQL